MKYYRILSSFSKYLQKVGMIFCIIFMSLPDSSFATVVQLEFNGLKLNAEFKENINKQQPVFLILHGSLAWHGMELPTTIQTLLEEENYASLAFSLSLGQDDRHGFYDCKKPILSGHGDAQAEIELWIGYLKNKGYNNIVLVGHSRGGSQIASFAVNNAVNNADIVNQIFLIAPMTWQESAVHRNYDDNNKIPLATLLKSFAKDQPGELKQQNILHCSDATISGNAFLSYYTNIPEKNTPTLLSDIKVNTRVYLGSDDPLTKRILQQQASFEENKKVSIFLVDGADHFFRDLYADDIISDMIDTIK